MNNNCLSRIHILWFYRSIFLIISICFISYSSSYIKAFRCECYQCKRYSVVSISWRFYTFRYWIFSIKMDLLRLGKIEVGYYTRWRRCLILILYRFNKINRSIITRLAGKFKNVVSRTDVLRNKYMAAQSF